MKKQKSIPIRELNTRLVRPGCTEPISIQALYDRIRDHGFKSHEAILDGQKRACLTEQQAGEIEYQFNVDHAKKRRRLAAQRSGRI